MTTFTVNVQGDQRDNVSPSIHSYYANGVTALEIPAKSKAEAKTMVERMGFKVLYVFE